MGWVGKIRWILVLSLLIPQSVLILQTGSTFSGNLFTSMHSSVRVEVVWNLESEDVLEHAQASARTESPF